MGRRIEEDETSHFETFRIDGGGAIGGGLLETLDKGLEGQLVKVIDGAEALTVIETKSVGIDLAGAGEIRERFIAEIRSWSGREDDMAEEEATDGEADEEDG